MQVMKLDLVWISRVPCTFTDREMTFWHFHNEKDILNKLITGTDDAVGELTVNCANICRTSACANLYLLKEAGGAAGIARHRQPLLLSDLINELLMEGGEEVQRGHKRNERERSRVS